MSKHLHVKIGLTLILLMALPLTALAQRVETVDSVYVFTMVKELPHSPVKSQGRTGTCWCFATMSLLESEAMRHGAPEDLDLSEMFVVRHTYEQKAAAYVRWHGNLAFGQGSMMHLAITQMDRYGLAPESAYTGRNIGLDTYNNGEVHAVLQNMLEGVLKARRPTPRWPEAVSVVLDTYLGASPESFDWNGKTVTPMAYRDALKLDPSDYIEVTSIDRAPFYTQVLSEFPDNWDYNDDYYNLPVEDLPGLIEQALLSGYSVVYAGDISGPPLFHRQDRHGHRARGQRRLQPERDRARAGHHARTKDETLRRLHNVRRPRHAHRGTCP